VIRMLSLLVGYTTFVFIMGVIGWLDITNAVINVDTGLPDSQLLPLVSWSLVILVLCFAVYVSQSGDYGVERFTEDELARLDAARETAFSLAPWVPTIWLSKRNGQAPRYVPFRNRLHWPARQLASLSLNKLCYVTAVYCHLAQARRKLICVRVLAWVGALLVLASLAYGGATGSWLYASGLCVVGSATAYASLWGYAWISRVTVEQARAAVVEVSLPTKEYPTMRLTRNYVDKGVDIRELRKKVA
jgi:hypothetical protein